jgi:iron complex outermembrane receptor protein
LFGAFFFIHLYFLQMRKLLLIACLLMQFQVFGQNNICVLVVSGRVIDQHDGSPVAAAKIQIRELSLGVQSDSNGLFVFPPVCMGTYSFVVFHHNGAAPVRFERDIHTSVYDTIYLEAHYRELQEAKVVANVFEMSTISVAKPTAIDRNYAAGKTLGDLMRTIPGVSALNTGSNISKPVVHGMHSNRVLILNNGVRQEGQQWGSEHAPEIDPFLSTEVSLVRGASAVRYGSDAIAGVILTAPKTLVYKPGLRGEVSLAAFSNGRQGSGSGMLEGGFRKLNGFSWRLQGTLKQGGTLQAPAYYLKNTAVKEYNFSLAANYESKRWGVETFYAQFNTDLGIFSGSHIGNLTDLNKAFLADKPLEEGSFTYAISKPNQHIEHELFTVKTHFDINGRNRLVWQYGRQYNLRQEYDRHVPYNDSVAALNLPSFQLTLVTHTADLKWEHQWLKNLKGEAGVSFLSQGNSYTGRFFIPNFKKQAAGVYLLEVWKLGKSELEAGIRADETHLNVYMYDQADVLQTYQHDFRQMSGSLGFSRLLGRHLVVRANVGTAWRPPSINELYSNGLHHGAAAIEVGNSQMHQEVSYAFQSGFTWKTSRILLEVDGYHNQIDGYIYLKPTLPPALTIKGAFPVFRFEQVNARFTGVDFLFSYDVDKTWVFTTKGAIVRAFNQSAHSYLVGIPADRLEPGITYVRSFHKQRQVLVNLSAPLCRTQDRVAANSDYVAPPKGYALLNAQISWSFQWKQQKIDLSLEISNLFNQSYRDYLNRFRYFADEVGRNVGLKIKIPFNIYPYSHEKK